MKSPKQKPKDRKKVVKVKAWAITSADDLVYEHIFSTRKEALEYKTSWLQKIIPITITYKI